MNAMSLDDVPDALFFVHRKPCYLDDNKQVPSCGIFRLILSPVSIQDDDGETSSVIGVDGHDVLFTCTTTPPNAPPHPTNPTWEEGGTGWWARGNGAWGGGWGGALGVGY